MKVKPQTGLANHIPDKGLVCRTYKELLGEGGVGGMDWEFGVGRCKLLYTGWINNKVLLCSTGPYIQCPEINHHGKECILKCIYV